MIVNQTGGGSAKESIEHFRGTLSVERSNNSESTAAILRLPFKADYTLILSENSGFESFPLRHISAGFVANDTNYYSSGNNRYYTARTEGNVTVVKGYIGPHAYPFVLCVEAFKIKE